MISVVVPVYNAGEYLETCVESVLAQSYGNFELILVDDGSTDGSGELCDKFAARDSRVKVLRRENGGVSRARNTGIEAAKGDVIAFLDCDDYILPDMYGTLLSKMEKAKARIAVCTVIDEREDGRVRKVDSGETMLITGRDALRSLVTGMGDRAENRETIWFSVWNKLYDASLFRENGIRFDPETDSAEDVPVNLSAFSMVDHIIYYETPFYFWRHRVGSQSDLRKPKALRGGFRTSRYLFDCAKDFAEKDRAAAVTASIRHFYWYYTRCVYALYKTRKTKQIAPDGSGGEDDATDLAAGYMALRGDMIAALREIAADPIYKKYTDRRFKATAFFMIHAPELFAKIWLCYRKLRRRG